MLFFPSFLLSVCPDMAKKRCSAITMPKAQGKLAHTSDREHHDAIQSRQQPSKTWMFQLLSSQTAKVTPTSYLELINSFKDVLASLALNIWLSFSLLGFLGCRISRPLHPLLIPHDGRPGIGLQARGGFRCQAPLRRRLGEGHLHWGAGRLRGLRQWGTLDRWTSSIEKGLGEKIGVMYHGMWMAEVFLDSSLSMS